MKKCFSPLLILITSAQFLNAQSDTASTTVAPPPEFGKSIAVKWNPGGLFFGNISLAGEYNFKPKKSLTFGIGIPSEKVNTFTIDDEKESITMKTFSVMAGYRMYMGKKPMSGFYFEPYLHYVKNEASTILDIDLNGSTENFLTTSDYKAFGLGAQLGVQALIAKRVTIDFFILGPEANSVKHSVVAKDLTSTLPWDQVDEQQARQEIEDAIGDIPLIGDKIQVTVDRNAKTVRTDYSGFLPGFRTGISIGFRF